MKNDFTVVIQLTKEKFNRLTPHIRPADNNITNSNNIAYKY